MNILITGAHGQLGKQLERILKGSHTVYSLGKNELDITIKENTEKIFLQLKPQIVIHAAAFTAVDQCEIDRKKAFEVNGIGTGYVAQAANKIQAKMFYISSDYVFDGKKQVPYKENDEPNPQSTYGMSKWLGEKLVQKFNNGTIIRTSWLYGHDGKNFVKTMLNNAKKNRAVKVVNDQIGSPTYVNDLADTIRLLLDKKSGIYHVSNTGSCSWFEFARAIYQEAGYNPDLVLPIKTEDYNALASRPKYSILGHEALEKEKIMTLRPWNEALKDFIRKEFSHDRRSKN
ncbi:dTDP-4-dehydrorhamnose reductase [Cytobacillus oceanisediminis]|uniref:dTDP-4-dehydrorhamnose reductase n=1 Tax=Cytobacillus oceanisediminis TaxID=665099 RepID=UPI001D14C2CE|nr:dTDP-4-dehydrorhamnose reductase [Cytobacillus oceanisediminis]MCC3646355.1 dTDP-4-dehydrorhamnose reductase [Cytobacillus oceanisediminis]